MSVFDHKKSQGKSLWDYFDVHSRTSSPEEQQCFMKELEDYFQTYMIFTGVYHCDIQNGRILIPWKTNTPEDPLCWMYLEYTEKHKTKRKIVLTVEKNKPESMDGRILEEGICECEDDHFWIIPECVLAFLNTRSCVWTGQGTFGELFSRDTYASTTEMDAIVEILKNNAEDAP